MIAEKILDLFRLSKRALILSHYNPDGDALGSASGLARAMESQGCRPALYVDGSWPSVLDPFIEGLEIDSELNSLAQYDLMVLLDCHSFDRLGAEGEAAVTARLAEFKSPPPLVVIDHHLLKEDEEMGENWIVHSKASSTGELVWSLLKELEWKPPKVGLQGLLLALASDTGFFSQSNTTPEALSAAADLVALGGDLEDITRLLRQDLPLRRYKLMALALDDLELRLDGRLAVMRITPAMLEKSEALMSDTEEFVDFGRSLAGVEISALIKDYGKGPGTIRVSLRSRNGINVQKLAKSFGGGGHSQASAYNDTAAVNVSEAAENLTLEAEKYL